MAIPLGTQQYMIRETIDVGGATDLNVDTYDSDHSLFLSMPTKITKIVQKAWATCTAQVMQHSPVYRSFMESVMTKLSSLKLSRSILELLKPSLIP